MPRRKYGRMQKPIPPVNPEKCRFCRLKRPCPLHGKSAKENPSFPER
ncbi:MAG: hypothetical protein KGJ23_06250 [Euryarchaeota archaeon]|nr:hypothetical protein [Euryarchaeota archaeon]MDE1836201.1 hypothetical protein [Euryarchaeota archaeon]MDE1881184.1 hypothetical protein [Euryarchaeota archaeon]MDE2045436.1 hypothetical protein [Thermoplasmata archaeon]